MPGGRIYIMSALAVPFLIYALTTTFTPGPNNITSSSIGMRLGYRKTVPYLLGVLVGFFVIMALCGLLTEVLKRFYGNFSPYLKWIGVLYILWLIVSLFLHRSGGTTGRDAPNSTFFSGLLLQIVNIKVILYGITLYTSFSTLVSGSIPAVAVSAALLALLGFVACSCWALLGSAFSRFLARRGFALGFNLVMAALLAYTAVSIALH
jgi:cysteine/O-acetylserine efflux protein